MTEKILELKNLHKSFGNLEVLKGIDLSVNKGDVISIIGSSGSGKTSLLRCLNFLEKADEGELVFDGQTYDLKKMHKKQINEIRKKTGFVFQNYNLFRNKNVLQNVTEGLIVARKIKKEQAEKSAVQMLKKVGMEDRAEYFPHQLSGGQQQRVAIARALINNPRVLLLDEPLAALDLKLRKDMQNELKNIQKQTGITFIYVTHDQEEALSMSDTIVVMADGEIQQIGTPTDIYNEPQNAFVADFIGESNILDGVMLRDYRAKFSGQEFDCVDAGFAPNESVDIVVRPEDVDIVEAEKGMLRGKVTAVTFKGVYYEIIVDISGFKWMIQTTDYCAPGSVIGLYIEPDAIHVMKKSEYSNMFGDYSSFSEEFDELSDVDAEVEEEAAEE